jgi:hypothetical protein
LWNPSNEFLEEFKMKIMTDIDDASLGELKIIEVEEKREANQVNIEQLTEANQ